MLLNTAFNLYGPELSMRHSPSLVNSNNSFSSPDDSAEISPNEGSMFALVSAAASKAKQSRKPVVRNSARQRPRRSVDVNGLAASASALWDEENVDTSSPEEEFWSKAGLDPKVSAPTDCIKYGSIGIARVSAPPSSTPQPPAGPTLSAIPTTAPNGLPPSSLNLLPPVVPQSQYNQSLAMMGMGMAGPALNLNSYLRHF